MTPWHGVDLVEPLPGGARNRVFLARRGGRRLVVRTSTRAPDALRWELDLLDHLAAAGFPVPVPVPSDDGRRQVDGVMVTDFVAGRPPRDVDDWRRVVETLETLHELTVGWPQRPGFASSRELLTADRGGDVRLDTMPPDGVRAVRAAWRPLAADRECVVHGDVGAGNILVDGSRMTLLDWDESRVDVPWFDFAFVPEDVEVPVPVGRSVLVTAGIAWEAATCWVPEPEYAARRLAELHTRGAV
ncbi:phosphotransferase enzyme family protein [Virgisporangium aurantiacum]|uniref:phosphotransferase enzyme family protein n=1 Tax=Virgisporangium aurantiacum TaxID=175570 RepID=UPI00194ED7A8|nr:phosphotransferase [Virgisporangium aurantiacum]